MAFADRRARLLHAAAQTEDPPDALLLSKPADVRWLTGLNSSNCVAVLSPRHLVLATDNRYAGQARELEGDFELVISPKVRPAALERFAQLEPEADEPDVQTEAVTSARAVKGDDELASIRSACELSVAALENVRPQIQLGQSEVVLARMLELEMAKLGAEDRAFPTIVATGPNSAVPHHAPTTRELQAGDLLKIDFGARVDGYNADCTRTFVAAADPSDWQVELYVNVLAASEVAKQAVRAGIAGAEVDAVARNYLTDRGWGEQFLHGLGHGVGLDIHEYPFLIPRSDDVLTQRSVFTIEPGLYLEGKGGVRIEDTCVLVDGELQVLTEYERDLGRVAG